MLRTFETTTSLLIEYYRKNLSVPTPIYLSRTASVDMGQFETNDLDLDA